MILVNATPLTRRRPGYIACTQPWPIRLRSTSDEVVYVWSVEQTESGEQQAVPKVTKLPGAGPAEMMQGV